MLGSLYLYSTKGKLNILQSHYEHFGSTSVEDAFDNGWKEEVENNYG